MSVYVESWVSYMSYQSLSQKHCHHVSASLDTKVQPIKHHHLSVFTLLSLYTSIIIAISSY